MNESKAVRVPPECSVAGSHPHMGVARRLAEEGFAMTKNRMTYAVAGLMLVLAAAGTANARRNRFANRLHTTLAQDGVTSEEIVDGTVTCADLSPEVAANECGGSDAPTAENIFVDGFTQVNKDMPSTPSGNDPRASIAKLTVGEGSQVILATIVWSASPLNFSGIVTCHLVP